MASPTAAEVAGIREEQMETASRNQRLTDHLAQVQKQLRLANEQLAAQSQSGAELSRDHARLSAALALAEQRAHCTSEQLTQIHALEEQLAARGAIERRAMEDCEELKQTSAENLRRHSLEWDAEVGLLRRDLAEVEVQLQAELNSQALREQLERHVREELGAEKERHAHTLTTLDVSTPRIRKFQVPSPSSELPERVTGSAMDRETDTKITHEELPPKTSSAPRNTQSPPN